MYVFVVFVVVAGIYIINQRKPLQVVETGVENESRLPQALNPKHRHENDDTEVKITAPTTMEKELYLWRGQIKGFFSEVLPQDQTAFMDYQELKDGFEEDRLDAYDRFMEEARDTGEEFNLTDLDDGDYKKIQDEYLLAFEKRFGKEVFVKYLKVMEDYNEKVITGNDKSLKVNF